MRGFGRLVGAAALAAALGMGGAAAQELSSSLQFKVKKVTAQIAQMRSSLAANGAALAGDDFKRNQFGDRVASFRDGLARYPANSDPAFAAAMAELEALEAEFAALGTGAPAPEAPTQAAAEPSPAAASGETATAAPAAPPPPAEPEVRPLVSGERVRVKRLTRDIQGLLDDLVTEGPSHLQSAEVVERYKSRMGQFSEALKRYPQVDDPDVQAARKAYVSLREALAAEFERAKGQRQALGDVFARLRVIEGRDAEYPVPDPLEPPFDEAAARAWLDAGSKARTAAEFDWKQLLEIAPLAYLPKETITGRSPEFAAGDLDRLGRIVQSRATRVQETYSQTVAKIDRRLAVLENKTGTPTARSSLEGMAEDRAALEAMIPVAASRVVLEGVLGRPTEEAEAAVATLRERLVAFDVAREAAIDATRMPEPGMTDPELLAIAEEVVGRPRYEFGEHGPIVIVSEKVSEGEREDTEIEIDDVDVGSSGDIKMSGTKTTYFYKWRQFQFATPLREPGSDLWRIWYINARFYEKGAPTTPIGEWVSWSPVDGALIREENFR